MDNKQFCYWLHGYFEIGDMKKATPYLNAAQLDIVSDHIKLVTDEVPWTCGFIQWLQGLIDAAKLLKVSNVDYVELSKAISYKLDAVFEKKTQDRRPEATPPLFPQLSFPNHPIIPRDDLICENDDKLMLDCAKPDLEEVLQNIDAPTIRRPNNMRRPKVYCSNKGLKC